MFHLILLLWAALASAQYDGVERQSVSFPSKSSLGPLYSTFSGPPTYRDTSYEDNAVTPTPSPTPIYRNPSTVQQVYRKPTSSSGYPPNQQRGLIRGPGVYGKGGPLEEAPLEEEKDEPDRLSLLLPQSKFDCVGKQTGYYADEDLNCEVFHYCHDNARHSWICPEGFTFHQVHLICMPPNGDISCKKSSQYHFVNEYLYKPLNSDEAESKPNVTLRYSERYFPSDIYTDERESQHYRVTVPPPPARRPIFLTQQQPSPTSAILNSIPTQGRPQPSPLTQFRLPINQVFRSAEEINIPLQQRRPLQATPHTLRTRFPTSLRDDEEYE